MPMTASSFPFNPWVNTHIPYTDGGYVNLGNDLADLQYLGITQVRDTLCYVGEPGSAPLSSFIYLAQQGIKFTFFVEAETTAALNNQLSWVDEVNQAVPGSVTAVEGPNEINNQPITYNGVSGLQGAINLQEAIYSAVKSDPNLSGTAVDYFTGYDAVQSEPVQTQARPRDWQTLTPSTRIPIMGKRRQPGSVRPKHYPMKAPILVPLSIPKPATARMGARQAQ